MLISIKKEYKTQFSEKLIKYNKFYQKIMLNSKKQNHSYIRKYRFKLTDSCKYM